MTQTNGTDSVCATHGRPGCPVCAYNANLDKRVAAAQTPSRDWQKDMELCEAATAAPWIRFENRIYGYCTTAVEPMVHEFNVESPRDCTNAEFISEARSALPYWLQEAKIYKQSYEATLTHYTAEKAHADDAEAREQRLKEALEELLSVFTMHSKWASIEDYYGSIYSLTDTDSEIVLRINSLVSTLYPDTPAPKEGTHNEI